MANSGNGTQVQLDEQTFAQFQEFKAWEAANVLGVNTGAAPQPVVAEVVDNRIGIQKGENGKPAVGTLAKLLNAGTSSVEWYTKHKIKYEYIRLVLQWDFGFTFKWNPDGKYHEVETPTGFAYQLFTEYANKDGTAGRKEFALV